MTFAAAQSKLYKKPITKVVITLDKCSRTFGIKGCTASGTKCFNTYSTCTDSPNYLKTTVDHTFVNNTASHSLIAQMAARPYLMEWDLLPTEIREDKTIPARANLSMLDELDNDIGVDPYVYDRTGNTATITGTFWKKLIERNPNYKGRTIKIYEGYEAADEADYVLRFSGRLENITIDGNRVKIAAVDHLKALDEIDYPFKLDVKLAAAMGQTFETYSEADMLALPALEDDFCKRTDFVNIEISLTPYYDGSGTMGDLVYFLIVGYDSNDKAIGRSRLSFVPALAFLVPEPDYDAVTVGWKDIDGAAKYRIYGLTDTPSVYLEITSYTPSGTGWISEQILHNADLTAAGTPPDEASRIYKLSGINANVLKNWTFYNLSMVISLDDASDLDSSGYIEIEDEIYSYSGITVNTLTGVVPLLFNTKSKRHPVSTNIKVLFNEDPENPFTLLQTILSYAGIDTDYIDTAQFTALESAWSDINFSTTAIVKETKGNKIYFDLVRVVGAKSWTNELGKVTIKLNSDLTVDHTISDEENIIHGSASVDRGQSGLKTRIIFNWNRWKLDGSLTDEKSYANRHILIDANAESTNEYDDEMDEKFYSTWINDDCGTADAVDSYIQAMLNDRLKRLRTPRPIISFEVEAKDSSILTGEIIRIETDELNDVDGTDYATQKFQVIKRDPGPGKIELTAQFVPVDSITVSVDKIVNFEEATATVIYEDLTKEVAVTNLEYNSSGSWASGSSLDADVGTGELILRWDNMFVSTATSVTLIDGTTMTLDDYNAMQNVIHYKVYKWVDDPDISTKNSQYFRPVETDSNGTWNVIATIPDKHKDNSDFKYRFAYKFKPSDVSRYLEFYVAAVTDLGAANNTDDIREET